ncbi:hypothetical protein OQA88_8223 [Cercophora sp. LCS_1]
MTSTVVQEAISLLSQSPWGNDHDVIPWRTEQLRNILRIAENAWFEGSHHDLAVLAETIADKARDPSWRLPVGDSGLLEFYLARISAERLELPLKKQCLRVIGNGCAECDENKARVVESNKLEAIVSLLDDNDPLLSFIISVIYNIAVENEKAQHLVCEAGLSKKLVDILAGPRLAHCLGSLSIIIQLMEQLVSQGKQLFSYPDPEPKVANPSTPAVLLKLARDQTYVEDLEDFTGLCTVALAYLTYEQFQTALLSSSSFPILQEALYDSYTRFDIAAADSDVLDQLKQVWNAAVTIYADISALPAFATLYPISDPVIQRFIAWLSTPPSYTHLQTAACLSLGNICRSDETSLALSEFIVDPLVSILYRSISPETSPTDIPPAQLLHAVLGFLKNLAIPSANKHLISASLFDAPEHILPRLWTKTTAQPQVQFASVSLTRLLLVNNPAAVAQLCSPSFALAYTTRGGAAKSNLHVLMDIGSRSDAEPTKMEAARAVCAVIRVLQAPVIEAEVLVETWDWGVSVEEGEKTVRARFYAAHVDAIAAALGGLLTQTKFTTLRSEALFVLALMGRSVDGGRVALKSLEPAEVCRVLLGAVLGREVNLEEVGESSGFVTEIEEGKGEEAAAPTIDPGLIEGLSLEPRQTDVKQSAGVAKDRENGLVLVAEIIRGFAGALTASRKKVFEDVLNQGGELLLAERNETQGAA